MAEQEEMCSVCGEVLDPDNTSRCSFCGGKFHMKWSVKVEMKECGRFVMNEQFCTVMFMCNTCAARMPSQQGPQQEPPQETW